MLVILSLVTEQLVRWPFPGDRHDRSLCPSPTSDWLFVRWLQSMASRKCTPRQHGATREPTGLGVISKATKDVLYECFLAVTGF